MSIFSRPIFAIFLIVLFLLAAIAGGPSDSIEVELMRRLTLVRVDWPRVTRGVAAFTVFGGVHVTLGLASLGSLWLLLRGAPGRALLLALTVLTERMLVDGLKEWIGRPRPPLEPLLIHSLAYPSGHSANSMTAFLAIAFIATPPAYRRSAAIAGLFGAVVVGLTRVWIGVHWPSDVIGGWAMGLLAVTAALAIGERSGAPRLEPKHEIVGRHGAAAAEEESA